MKKSDFIKGIISGINLSVSAILVANILSETTSRIGIDDYVLNKIEVNNFDKDNQDLLDAYNEYIILVCEAINKYCCDIDNPVSVFATYSYLLRNSLISKGESSIYGNPEFDIVGHLGMDVVNGISVCRNQAPNLADIFNKLGFDSGVTTGCLYKEGDNSDQINHAVTYVKYDDIIYLFDSTNSLVFLKNEQGVYKSIINDSIFDPSFKYDFIFYNNLFPELYSNISKDDLNNNREQVLNDFYFAYNSAVSLENYYIDYEDKYLTDYEEKILTLLNEYKYKKIYNK